MTQTFIMTCFYIRQNLQVPDLLDLPESYGLLPDGSAPLLPHAIWQIRQFWAIAGFYALYSIVNARN
jgi:hypothetical protein